MQHTDLADCSATELSRLYRCGQASPVEATSAVFARIDKLDGRLNAFVLPDPEGAARGAAESRARWARGEALGLLAAPGVVPA